MQHEPVSYEIHLHPRLQANLADLMIANITGRGEEQWIVETHSELLVLRIQRRIREGTLDPSDVSVLYVDPNLKQREAPYINFASMKRRLKVSPRPLACGVCHSERSGAK